jgi:ribosome maturation factor RimP
MQEAQVNTIQALLQPLLEADIFLVDIKIKPTNNIKIYLDADSGLSIEKCIKINRALYKQVEEKAIYPNGDFSLEISSPGIDEPLKLLRQYQKNIGRHVEMVLKDGKKEEGKLLEVTEQSITIEQTEGKGKKAITRNTVINSADIKQTTVLVKF